jgi:hypothetical protein
MTREALDAMLYEYRIIEPSLRPVAFQFKIPEKIQYKPKSKLYKSHSMQCVEYLNLKRVFSCKISHRQNNNIYHMSRNSGINILYATPEFINYATLSRYYWDSQVQSHSSLVRPELLDNAKSHTLYYYPGVEPEFHSKPIKAYKVEAEKLKEYANEVDRKTFLKETILRLQKKQILDAVIVFCK